MHTKCFNLLQVIFSLFPFSLPFSNAFRGCPLSFYLLWVKPVNISGHFVFLPSFWVTMRCNELIVMCYEIEIQTCEVPKIPWGHSESLFSTFLLFFLLPNRVFNQNSLFIIYVLPFWLLLHLYFALCLVLFHHQVLRLVSIIIILLLLWSGVLVLLRMTYYRRLWLEALCELGLPQQNFKWERENWSRYCIIYHLFLGLALYVL